MPNRCTADVSFTPTHYDMLKKFATEQHSTLSGVIRSCIDFCLDADPFLKLPLALARASEATLEYELATSELARIKGQATSDEPKTPNPLSPRAPRPEQIPVYVNRPGSGSNPIEGQVEHDHEQFLRLTAEWDTLGIRAKTKIRDLAAKHSSWVAELTPERQQSIREEASESQEVAP